MSVAAPPVQVLLGGLGKLPSQPEFIRVNTGTREVQAFDQTIQEGLYYMKREYGAAWETTYDHRLFHRFVYRADNCGQTLVGVMRGAMDSVERRYPFAAFYLIPTLFLDTTPAWVPDLEAELFAPLEQLIEELAETPNLAVIKRRFQDPVVLPRRTAASEQRYHELLDDVECQDLGAFPGSSVDRLLGELVSFLPGADGHPKTLSATLALPLIQPGYARGLEIRFWLELVMLLLNWYPPTFSYFWQSGKPSPAKATLQLTFRQPPGYFLPELLNDGTALIKGVWRPGLLQPFPGGAVRRGVLKVGPTSSLRHLLQSIDPGYPDACRWTRR